MGVTLGTMGASRRIAEFACGPGAAVRDRGRVERQCDAADEAPTFEPLEDFEAPDVLEPGDVELDPAPAPEPLDFAAAVPSDFAATVLGSFVVDELEVLDSPDSLPLEPDSPDPELDPLPAGTMPPRPERESLW